MEATRDVVESSQGAKAESKSSLNADAPYKVDAEKQEEMRRQKAFRGDQKYFKNVRISPSASMKMMMHVQSGVNKRSALGKPTEVMGFLVGRQCTEDPHSVIITDAQALAVEGFETSVVVDTDEAHMYQINWQEANSKTKHPADLFCGWYHSHPFDLDEVSHCYFSNTDISTQLAYQNMVEVEGIPWVGIVIDPLRTLAKGQLELRAFRTFSGSFSTAETKEAPDGKVITDLNQMIRLWGHGWAAYYMLNTSYYMSSLSSSVLGILKNNFFWVDALSNTPAFASEQRQMAADRLTKIAADMTGLDKVHGRASSARSDGPDSEGKSPLSKLAQGGCSSAVEGCQHCCQQMAKLALFGNPNLLASQRRAKLSAEASAAGASLST